MERSEYLGQLRFQNAGNLLWPRHIGSSGATKASYQVHLVLRPNLQIVAEESQEMPRAVLRDAKSILRVLSSRLW